MRAAACAAALAVLGPAPGVPAASAGAPQASAAPRAWLPPLDPAPGDAPPRLVDAFRPAACRWCPGHRGLAWSVSPGTRVVAVDDGEVTFAGRVAGRTWVVLRVAPPLGVRAPDVRVTYGGVREVRVRAGDRVSRGATLGVTGDALHLGVRLRGGAPSARYVDPAPMLVGARPRAVLVRVPD